jgi:anhydro-N-acetylmuramic acid kinase
MIAVGLMSGTSADGVSVAAIRVEAPLKLLAYRTFPYPAALRERVLARGSSARRSCRSSTRTSGVLRGVREDVHRPRAADVIGSHGQTVWHEPGRHTLQLGEAAHIAEATGRHDRLRLPTRDIAAAGRVRRSCRTSTGFVFGVAMRRRSTWADRERHRPVEDAARLRHGPGNCLIDEAMRLAFGGPATKADASRRRAHRPGRCSPGWIIRISAGRPQVDGRELFSRDFLSDRCGKN